VSNEQAENFAILQRLRERFATGSVALAAGGAAFEFSAPLGTPVGAGTHVVIRTTEHGDVLGLVVGAAVAFREGSEVKLAGEAIATEAVESAIARFRVYVLDGTGLLLGRLGEAGFTAGVPSGFAPAQLTVATDEQVAAYLAASQPARGLDVGAAQDAPDRRVILDPRGLRRHLFICGQSGSGKTYALGVLLEQLLAETDLPLVILDPNSDHVLIGEAGEAASPERAAAHRRRGDHVVVARADARQPGATDRAAVRFSDLERADQLRVLRLDPLADRAEHHAVVDLIEDADGGITDIADLREAAAGRADDIGTALVQRLDNLGLARWTSWAGPAERSLADLTDVLAPATVVDLGGIAAPVERSLAALAVLSRLWARRGERRPVLVVLDEAHHICPEEPENELQRQTTELAVLIAGEGRKYGIYLLLATQRPQKVHRNVVSQCENIVLMRMNSATDVDALAAMFSHVPASLLQRATRFRLGDALVAGGVVAAPRLLRFGGRVTSEGGSDVPATWATPAGTSAT
jgi:hypothetical protein